MRTSKKKPRPFDHSKLHSKKQKQINKALARQKHIGSLLVSYKPLNIPKMEVRTAFTAFKIFHGLWDKKLIQYQEDAAALFLNNQFIAIGYKHLFRGGISHTAFDIRVLLGVALQCGATYIIIAHNHPSGVLKPSGKDIALTKKVKKSTSLLDMKLIDHLIIGFNSYFSFANKDIL